MNPETVTLICIALAGVLGLGALMMGMAFIVGIILAILQIWQLIRPKTDAFATAAWVKALEERQDQRHKENSDRFTKLEDSMVVVNAGMNKILGSLEKNGFHSGA